MNFQQIAVYIIVLIALAFLVNKFFIPKKKKKNGCDTDCGCH